MDAHAGHTPLARWLHWAVALGLPVVAGVGWMGERAADPARGMDLLRMHFGLGIGLLLLVAVRTARRLFGRMPPHVASSRASRRLAACVHGMLYALLWLLPASGYVIWAWMDAPMDLFGFVELPRLFEPPADDERGRALAWYVHVWGGWLLGGLVALHLAAVGWHAWVLRDGLPRRMAWPGWSRPG